MFRASLVGPHRSSKAISPALAESKTTSFSAARLTIASACAVSLMLAGCSPDLPDRERADGSGNGAQSTNAQAQAVTSTIGPKGGRIELAPSVPSFPGEKVALDVPEGALSSPVELTMILVAAEKATVGDGYEIAGRHVRIEPGGLELERPATLSLPFAPADEGARYVSVLTRENAEVAWTPMPTSVVDKEERTVSASLWHLSEYRPAYLVSEYTFDTAFDPERDGFGFADIGHNIGHPQDCPDGASIAFAAYASWLFEHKPDAGLKRRYCSSCLDPRSLVRSEVIERSRLLCEDGLALTCGLFLRFYPSWVSILRGFDALDEAEDSDWQQYWSIRSAMFRTAKPQLLLLGTSDDACNDDTCHHSVLAIAYTPHSIKIYDPSYPEETRELAFVGLGMEEYDGRYVKLYHLGDYPIFKVIEEMGLFEAFDPKMCQSQASEAAASTIGRKGGTLELALGVPTHPDARAVLDVPMGALSAPVELTMSLAADEESTAGDGYEVAGGHVRIEPGGLELERPATLSLPWFPADEGARYVSVLSRESEEVAWTALPTYAVDEEEGTVSASLWHFSEFRAAYLVSDDAFDTGFDPERDGFGFADIGHPENCANGAGIAFAGYASWFFEHKTDVDLMGRYCSFCFDPQSLVRSEVIERSQLLCEDGLALTCDLFLHFHTLWVSILHRFDTLDEAEDEDWQQYWSIRGAMFRTGKPQLLGLSSDTCNDDTCRHGVLAIAYTDRSIKIYDPRYPEETRELTFEAAGMEEYDGRYVKLYHLSDYPIFKVIEEVGLFEAFEPHSCHPESCDGCDNDCDGDVDEDGICDDPAFKDPLDTNTEEVLVTITQIDTTPRSRKIKLFAKVETEHGKPLQRLTAGNFMLRETVGGMSSAVTVDSVYTVEGSSEAISAGLLIDSSGSMGSPTGSSSPLGMAKVAAKLFVEELKPEDAAAVVNFGSAVQVQCEFTNDKQTLFAAIEACADGGSTSMYDALLTGIEMAAGRSGQRALVLLSDGVDNDSVCSPWCKPNVAIAPAAENGVPIFTIGLGARRGSVHEAALIAISDGSFAGRNGSGYYSTGDPSDLEAIYDSIATVLKNMYIVGWYTTGDPGEIVDVAITVSYACANGLFTDTFSVQYLVPEQ